MVIILKKEIILSGEQEACVKDVAQKFICEGRKIYTISAPAGTGKTTIIPYIIDNLALRPYEVAYVSFTGKAVRVMRDNGLPAETIHHLIYDARKTSDGEWYFKRKGLEDLFGYKLIVVDEISMVSTSLMSDLLQYRIPLLCLGDNAQLPPVMDSPNNLLSKPDFVLTKIFRQKEGSSIIDLATQIRETGELHSDFNDSQVKTIDLSKGEKIGAEDLETTDIILCATNRIKYALIDVVRKHKGLDTAYPSLFEPIVINRNYWQILSQKGEPLTNGTICTIIDIQYFLASSFDKYAEVTLTPNYDTEDRFRCKISLNKYFDLADVVASRRTKAWNIRVSCDFAYALTIHKSQGSQFDNVLVYTKDAFGDTKKMLYTAVTRARKKLIYVQ